MLLSCKDMYYFVILFTFMLQCAFLMNFCKINALISWK